jgi:ABC-type transport system involved in multi-copper enzyme maturation permease subunit
MKFIAILKDSLREAIDAKVFYVMVGLSLLMIALAGTAKFGVQPGGRQVAGMAAMPLMFDLTDLDPNEFQGGPVDGDVAEGDDGKAKRRRGGGGGAMAMMRRQRGMWKVNEVKPLDNADDLPTSTFRATLQPVSAFGGFFTPPPEKRVAEIKERFGLWDDVRLVDLLDVTHEKGEYRVDFKVTEAGRRLWPHDFSLFFGALPVFTQGVPLGFQLFGLETILINGIGSWIAILISVVITAFFIPNMLRKGTVDMLIVKPVHRTTLLLYKYVGGLLFILINTTIAVGGVWLALSYRSGIWAPGFLISIPVITFFFAILYSVSTLFGVLTRSPIVSILMTLGVWFVLFVVGLTATIFDTIEKQQEAPVRRNASQLAATAVAVSHSPLEAVVTLAERMERVKPVEKTVYTFGKVVRAVHFVLPRTRDLDTLTSSMLQRDLMMMPQGLRAAATSSREMTWGESLTVSGVFIALMLGVSCWWFATKDY